MKKWHFLLIGAVIVITVLFFFLFFTQEKSEDAEITLFGNVDVREVDLGFRVKGRVQGMVFEEGDFVPQGSFMAYLDKQPYEDLVQEARAKVESIQVELKNAENLLIRRQELEEGGGVSVEDVENAFASRDVYQAKLKEAVSSLGVALTHYNDTELYAPIDGTILTRVKEPGSVVKEADPIYTLSITSPVWVRAYIPEPLLGLIYPSQKAQIYTDTKALPVYEGHIGFISSVSEFTPKNVESLELRTDLVYRIRVVVDNPDRYLKQGMPVTVKIPLSEKKM